MAKQDVIKTLAKELEDVKLAVIVGCTTDKTIERYKTLCDVAYYWGIPLDTLSR